MNDTPQGDGNVAATKFINVLLLFFIIRMNDTPQGDGNSENLQLLNNLSIKIRMNDTPQGDGNEYIYYNKYT